jgi:hypothetical protein
MTRRRNFTLKPLEYIQSKGFDHKVSAGQILLKICPFCGDGKYHFYVDPSDDGLFFCHKCQERGNLNSLKNHFGDFQHRPLVEPGNGAGQRRVQKDIF